MRDDQDEPEEEEDQLIDDDDDALQPSATSSSRPTENRKLPAKKKARKGNKTTVVETGEKSKEKVTDLMGTQNLAPTMSCFKATPVESHEDAGTATIPQTKAPNDATPVKVKKVSPRRPLTMPRAKTKSAKYVYFS